MIYYRSKENTKQTIRGAVKMTTTKGYLTNEGTVRAYFDNTYTNGHAQKVGDSNVFFEGNKLFSYGYHFPMVIKHEGFHFVNADSYSSSTGKHQSYVQRMVPKRTKIEIPFSALESAGIDIQHIEVIDKEDSRYIQVERKDRETGEMVMGDIHLMGSTLFKHVGVGNVERIFLSGIDETAKDLWNGFFLTQLVGNPTTVAEAYEGMKPDEVKNLELAGYNVRRQGEYFFVECLPALNSILNKETEKLQKKVALSHKKRDTTLEGQWNFSQSRHVVTNCIDLDGQVFAKGTCRHVGGEHKMLKLDKWHLVFENVQEKSWTSKGRVD